MPFKDTTRSAEYKPAQIVDIQGAGPHLWEFAFVSDNTGGNSILAGVFVTRRGRWVKFTGLTATPTAKSIIKMCADSGVTWSDAYCGMIVTSFGTNGVYYGVTANYDQTLDSSPDSTFPHVTTGTFSDVPKTFGRVFKS